jgi:hypothetical protein
VPRRFGYVGATITSFGDAKQVVGLR